MYRLFWLLIWFTSFICLAFTSPRLGLAIHRRTIMFKWILGAIFYGWIASAVTSVPQKVTLVYASSSLWLFFFVIYVFLIMQGLLFKNRLLFCYFVTDKIDTVWSSQLCVCSKGFLWWRFLYFHIQWLTSWLQKRIALPIQCRLWGWKLNCWILCEWHGAVRASHWKPTNRIIKWDCYIWVSCSSPIIMWFCCAQHISNVVSRFWRTHSRPTFNLAYEMDIGNGRTMYAPYAAGPA